MDDAAPDAATGKPGRKAGSVMIAATRPADGRASELTRPHHQRFVQHAATFEIGDQSGDRLIRLAAHGALAAVIVAMGIPPRTVKQLHETHTPFDEPSGRQAVAAEGIRGQGLRTLWIVGDAVQA